MRPDMRSASAAPSACFLIFFSFSLFLPLFYFFFPIASLPLRNLYCTSISTRLNEASLSKVRLQKRLQYACVTEIKDWIKNILLSTFLLALSSSCTPPFAFRNAIKTGEHHTGKDRGRRTGPWCLQRDTRRVCMLRYHVVGTGLLLWLLWWIHTQKNVILLLRKAIAQFLVFFFFHFSNSCLCKEFS